MDREQRPTAAPVRRQLDRRAVLARHLAAAVELERDQPREREGPVVELGAARPDLVGAVAARRLSDDVVGALELRHERQPVGCRRGRLLYEDLE